ncbi:efflux RND transporter periplasmic adaptor subunit [Luteimonas composti]|uniref:Efflux RND transporter periplasmic adaptor subunit n=1 Tax=Luteimonas composti TaxID=398257 RepID=A0ABT6MQQ0_9GAMM|nr:efflux RND transporter periplasmic adaptor subunit [Luteimonas composti]MDH7452957.1 efflux RND transporter periplasmic adaptor subunit [Luteimonas composti]
MRNQDRRLPVWIGLALAGLLSACSGGDAADPAPRPVLVERPQGGPDAAIATFAGEIRARRESPLSFRIGGNLVRRLVDAGERVREGQVLAELDPGDQRLQAEAARAQLAAAEAELARVRADRARYQTLARDQLVSRSAMDAQDAAWRAAEERARTARAQLDVASNQAAYATLRAPRDGVIASRAAEAGQVVAAGQAIYTLAGDDGREVAIALPESRIGEFRLGQEVEVELWDAPGERMRGSIREIAAAADPQARTFAARVALAPEAAARAALGQSARVFVARNGERAALSVPLSALQPGPGGGHAVWVVAPGTGALRLVPVQAGTPGQARVPVLSGLSPEDWVVSAGGHLLREGLVVAPVDRDNRPVVVASAAGADAPR